MRLYPQPRGHVGVSLGYCAGGVGRLAVGHSTVCGAQAREHEQSVAEGLAECFDALFHALSVFLDEDYRFGVECQVVTLVGLGCLFLAVDPISTDVDRLAVQIEAGETEAAEFASAHSGCHGEPDERSPVVVILVHAERFFGELGGLGG